MKILPRQQGFSFVKGAKGGGWFAPQSRNKIGQFIPGSPVILFPFTTTGGVAGVNPRNPTKTGLKVTPIIMVVDFAIIFILPLFLGTETVLPPYTALL